MAAQTPLGGLWRIREYEYDELGGETRERGELEGR